MAGSIRERLVANWGWVVVFFSFLFLVMLSGIMYTYGILFVEFQKEFNSSATLTGWVGGIPVALSILTAPPALILVEYFGYRPVAFVALILSTAGLIATSFMPSLAPMFATYSIMYGGGAGVACMTVMKLVLSYFPNKKSTRASGIALSGCSVGMLSLAQLLSLLVSRYGWRISLRIFTAMYFTVGVACVAVFFPPKAKNGPALSKSEPSIQDKEHEQSLEQLPDSSGVLQDKDTTSEDCNDDFKPYDSKANGCVRNKSAEERLDDVPLARLLLKAFTYPEMVMISSAMVLISVCDCFYYINTVSYMVSVGFSEADGARFVSVIGASTLVGKLVFSVVAEYLPFPPYFIMVMVALVGCAVMVSFMVVSSIAVLLSLAAVIGVMMSISALFPYTIPMEFFGLHRARFIYPVLLAATGSGFLLGSFVGQSIDRTGSYTSAISAFIAMYVVIALLFIAAPLYQRRYAPHRYVLMDMHRLQAAKKQRDQEVSSSKAKHIEANEKYVHVKYEHIEKVSNV